jgi:hypothetical protein
MNPVAIDEKFDSGFAHSFRLRVYFGEARAGEEGKQLDQSFSVLWRQAFDQPPSIDENRQSDHHVTDYAHPSPKVEQIRGHIPFRSFTEEMGDVAILRQVCRVRCSAKNDYQT